VPHSVPKRSSLGSASISFRLYIAAQAGPRKPYQPREVEFSMGEGASIAEIEPSIASFAEKRAQQDWKRQVLAREIELEEIDTTPFRDRYGPNSVQITPQAAEWSVVLILDWSPPLLSRHARRAARRSTFVSLTG
jgi:hypothetical protein